VRPLLVADLAIKAIAIALPLYAVVALDAASGAGTAILIRLLVYPLSVAAIPLVWWASGRPSPYPFVADIALVGPFILDAARIGFDLSSKPGLDALPHIGGWFSISVVVGLAVGPIVRERWVGFGLMVGTGAVIAIAWEVGEFLISRGGGGFELTYGNTIADLSLSLLGSVIGAIAMVTVGWPPVTTPRTPFGWSR
jgi:hypothetical protein